MVLGKLKFTFLTHVTSTHAWAAVYFCILRLPRFVLNTNYKE